jgi:hypothetical protein
MWKTPGFVYNLSENSLFYGLFSTSTLVHPRLPGNFHRLKKCVTILIYFGWEYLPARGLKLAMKKKHCQLGILLVMLFATWSCVDGELYPGSGDQMVWTGD